MKKLAVIVVLCGIIAGAWYFAGRKDEKRNTILIVIDTLRADHLGVYGYERNTSPVLDKFARENSYYTRAIAVAPWTPPSVTSILSGLYPSTHKNMPHRQRTVALQKGMKVPDDIILMQEIFKRLGYQTAALSSNPWINDQFGFGRGFDSFYFRDHAWAAEMVKASKRVIDNFKAHEDTPFFFYFHLLDPHNPYGTGEGFEFSGSLKERQYDEKAMDIINRYDADIAFMDYHLGDFFDYLRKNDFYEDTDIIIVSDHGEQFYERGEIGHGKNLFIEELRVPLMIKAPGFKGKKELTVSHVDILPTVLTLIGQPVPPALHGIALSDEEKIAQREGVYSEVYRKYSQRAFSEKEWRLITEVKGPEDKNAEFSKKGLFNNASDPLEMNPLEDERKEKELFEKLKRASELAFSEREIEEVQMDENTLKQLETLGYIN